MNASSQSAPGRKVSIGSPAAGELAARFESAEVARRVGAFAYRAVAEQTSLPVDGWRQSHFERTAALAVLSDLAWARACIATLDYYGADVQSAFVDMVVEPEFMQSSLYHQFWRDVHCAWLSGANNGEQLRQVLRGGCRHGDEGLASGCVSH